MNTKGRCRGNGAQLGNYLLNTKDNVRAECLMIHGATSHDPRRALLEMSLTSELTSRTKDGLYHMQLSPRAEEAAEMTWEQKVRAVEITAQVMELEGHKWALFEHEKDDGRIHMHLVFERYNHDTGRMWKDDKNYEKHMRTSRQMEIEFGWQLTHEKKNYLDKDVQDHITDLWIESDSGAGFVKAMDKAGFEVTQGIDRRPYQIVDQYGTVHDLSRQLHGFKQADVSQYLNSIRADLRPTGDASHDRRKQYERDHPAPIQADTGRDLSDSQDLAAAMLKSRDRERVDQDTTEAERLTLNYGFKFDQPLAAPQQPEPAQRPEPQPDLSENQDLALAMIAHQREKQADRENKLKDAIQQGQEQTQLANDNQSPKYYNPVTGQEMTAEAYQKMQDYLARQEQRKRERQGRSRGGYER